MSLNDEVAVLRCIPMFQNVDPARLKLIAFTSERLTFAPGRDLFRAGDHGDAVYVILAGLAHALIATAEGEIKVAEFAQNDVVGEIAVLCDVPRTATVRAIQDVTVLKIGKDLFLKLVSELPQLALSVMRELAHRLDITTVQLSRARNELLARQV
ncbi:cyclic nucleotide-binding domain-containing protein [Zavarzinia sp. CC-PAN008]|uniref:cyclic nucleotide-binding domain-containing protein n=1 Tax=Zavarzinia sp. CC-PAN008 TaxID=3243332 RepID=UPI003F74530D